MGWDGMNPQKQILSTALMIAIEGHQQHELLKWAEGRDMWLESWTWVKSHSSPHFAGLILGTWTWTVQLEDLNFDFDLEG
jgi:hypothetical protein